MNNDQSSDVFVSVCEKYGLCSKDEWSGLPNILTVTELCDLYGKNDDQKQHRLKIAHANYLAALIRMIETKTMEAIQNEWSEITFDYNRVNFDNYGLAPDFVIFGSWMKDKKNYDRSHHQKVGINKTAFQTAREYGISKGYLLKDVSNPKMSRRKIAKIKFNNEWKKVEKR